MIDPLLLDIPARIATARLVLRCAQAGDGAALNAAVCDSLAELRPWMPWARQAPTPDASEAYCRRAAAQFASREELNFLIFEADERGAAGPLIGSCGLHHIDWAVPRLEIGYWRHSGRGGRGLVAEAVHALERLAFEQLGARRVEIRVDDRNVRSARVAERAGFTLEGVLRCEAVGADGEVRDTRVYARVRGVERR